MSPAAKRKAKAERSGLRFRGERGATWIEIVDPNGDVARHKLTKRDALDLLAIATRLLTGGAA